MKLRYGLLIVSLLLVGLIAAPFSVQAQNPPEQIQTALNDLGARVGADVTLENVTAFTYEGRQFNDASLDCPQPDESYAQVITPGYQFVLTYEGQDYDYRVSEDNTIVILCSVEPADGTVPVTPDIYQMQQPILAVTPLTGMPNTPVQLTANGFPANAQVNIGIGLVESEFDVVQTLQTDAEGTLNAEFMVPDFYSTGDSIVFVAQTADNTLRVISYPFTVMGETGEVPGNPQVMLSSLTGAPGTAVDLTATGFPANASVLIGFGLQGAEDFAYSLQETTDAQGSLTLELSVPADAQVNTPYVALVELESDRTYEATSPVFTPVSTAPAATATPVPDDGGEFTSAFIYLIAMGDNGESGMLIGCEDSAIPVEVAFEPTVAPLTSALEQLLAINSEYYGQSGLYNALYTSSLTLDGIAIQNGAATIRLSGNLQIGGACDAPRIDAQLRQTALQFSTIDSATILINGQPLTDLLSAQ